jgi:hypothetical protein
MGYLIDAPAAQQIVTAKLTLKPVDLLAASITDIPEYPAVTGYYWQVISINGWINNGTTPYVGISSIHIQASAAVNPQFRFASGYLQDLNSWAFAPIIALNTIKQFVPDDYLQIHNPTALTIGDSDLTLYITAILIPS